MHQSAPYVRWGVCCACEKYWRVFDGEGLALSSCVASEDRSVARRLWTEGSGCCQWAAIPRECSEAA